MHKDIAAAAKAAADKGVAVKAKTKTVIKAKPMKGGPVSRR